MTEKAIRILYIEDEPGLARLVQRKLSRIGFDVVIASDGKAGLQELGSRAFSIVLLDQEMPGMTGIEVIDKLNPGTDDPPVIMLTGRGDEELAVEAIKKGAADYIVKDVDNRYMAVLPTVIERVLRAQADRQERERMRAELRQSERFLRATLDSFQAAVAIIDKDGVILSTNNAWRASAKKVGIDWTPIDRGDSYLAHCESSSGVFSEGSGAVAEGIREVLAEKADEFRHLYDRKLGEETRWFDMTVNLIESSDPPRALVVHTDVTKLRKTEERLRQAQKLEVVGRLTDGVAHEFNNLLQIVGGCLELALLEMTDDCPSRKHVDQAMRTNYRGARITEQLMAFSQRRILERTVIQPNEFLAASGQLLENSLGADVRIELELGDDIKPIRVDAKGLENAITNFALNARWAMPDGGVFTVLTSRKLVLETVNIGGDSLPPGEYVEIAFSDTGFGMSGEVLSNAFEPFFTTKEVGQGSGLGLSMVFGFARQLDGFASLDSEVDVGTTARLLLPTAFS